MNKNYSNSEIEKMMQNTHNQKCNDCDAQFPQWASINNAVFLCIKCAGVHRSFGMEISRVKSLYMDHLCDIILIINKLF